MLKSCYFLIATLRWLTPFFPVAWQGGSWSVFPKWWGFQHAAAVVGRGSNMGMAKGMVDWCGAADPGDPGGMLSQTRPTNPIRGHRNGSMTGGQEPEIAIGWTSIMIVIVRMCRK
jgi:hypothetical protein